MSNIKQYLTKDKLCLLSLPTISLIVKDNIFAGVTLTIFGISLLLAIIKSLLFGLLFFLSYLLGCLSLHVLRLGNVTVSVQSLLPPPKSKKQRFPTSPPCDICGNANCTKHNSSQQKPWMELAVDPQVDAALEELLGLLLKEHVYSWYRDISQDESFVHEVKLALRFLFSSLFKRAKQVDIPHLVLGPALQAALQHMEVYLASRKRAQSSGQVQEAVLRALGPRLHCALASRAQETRYLRKMAGLLLPYLLPPRLLTCQNAASLVRELLCTSVLLPVMDMLADPDVINHLLVLAFDPAPMVEYPCGTEKPVEFLGHFVSNSKPHSSSSSVFKFTLDTILAQQELLYTFMKFLEDEASVNVLQFCLTVDEFSNKLLTPDLGRADLESLHEQGQEIYNTYMAAEAIDRIRFDPVIVEEIKQILDGPVTEVTKLRTTASLFKAHQQAYLLLENNLCPLFHHSDRYLALLTGGRDADHSARHESRKLQSQASVRHPAGPRTSRDPVPPVEDIRMESSAPQTPELLFTSEEEEQIDGEDAGYRMDSDPRLKNLGAWRVSIPRVKTSIDQKCHFYETFEIEVQRIDGAAQDSPEDLHWKVERRYHEFYVLEAKLIEFHRELPDIHLPPKRTLGRKGLNYLESQRMDLEQFLRRLLSLPALQCSELLYKFLKSPQEFTSSFLPDIKLGKMIKNVPKKLVKEKGQHLNPFLQAFITSTEASKPRPGRIGAKSSSADAEVALRGSRNSELFQRSRPSYHEEPINSAASSQTITLNSLYESLLYILVRVYHTPMWLLQLLSAAEGSSRVWLQRLAEQFIKEKMGQVLRPGRILELLQLLKELLFLDEEVEVRSPREKSERAREAFQQVMDFFPEVVVRTLGKEKHQEGTQLLFNLLQYPLLNKQLTYVLLDIVAQHLFPELESNQQV